MWYFDTMKCYLATKRNKVLTHDTTQMNLENIVISRRGQSQRITDYIVPFIGKNKQNYRDRK